MKVVGLKSLIAEQERKQEDEDLSINPRKVRSERNDNSKRTRKVTNPKKEMETTGIRESRNEYGGMKRRSKETR